MLRPRCPLLLLACLLSLGGCAGPKPGPTGPPGSTPSDAVSTSPTAGETAGGSTNPSAGTSPAPLVGNPPSTGDLVLSEVRYAPGADADAFIEIANVAHGPIDLRRVHLTFDGHDLPLEAGGVLALAARLVIQFDGEGRAEPGVIHAPGGATLSPNDGVVELRDSDGHALDRVAWGDRPLAVSTGQADLVPDRVATGSSIGRPPGANDTSERLDWVVYPPDQTSPGDANPLPGVDPLLPQDGAILDEPGSVLSWPAVVGATSYRIQVDGDASFATPLVDEVLTDPEFPVAGLAPGAYVWRVAPTAGDGASAPFSPASGFTLEASATAAVSLSLASVGATVAVTAATTPGRRLQVPYLTQHKDTRMLLLESPQEHGVHAWDVDHGRPSASDPADAKNCAIAAVAIMNHFFHGDLSQDRLGYEILHNRQPGPEEDLMYGTGLTAQDATTMLNFALGGGVTVNPAYLDFADYFTDVRTQIDAGRPVMSANSHHTFVITGYAIRNGHRILYISDPANGRYESDLDAPRHLDPTDYSVWITPAHPAGRHQEAGVTKDSDGDGVVDFDETARFHTNPNDKDSDADKLPDKQDIITGVFDPLYGYAIQRTPAGRDFDSDGKPTELDKDSDAGVCWDGEEDTSKNGHRDGTETYNFDTRDDVCMAFNVTITWSETYGPKTDTFTFVGVIDTVDPNALGGVLFMTGTGTVRGSRAAWAACSVDVEAPNGTSPAFFGGTIIGDKITVGAFASEGVLVGVNTRDFEMPKEGGTQFFSGDGPGSDLCPYSWAAKVVVDPLIKH